MDGPAANLFGYGMGLLCPVCSIPNHAFGFAAGVVRLYLYSLFIQISLNVMTPLPLEDLVTITTWRSCMAPLVHGSYLWFALRPATSEGCFPGSVHGLCLICCPTCISAAVDWTNFWWLNSWSSVCSLVVWATSVVSLCMYKGFSSIRDYDHRSTRRRQSSGTIRTRSTVSFLVPSIRRTKAH